MYGIVLIYPGEYPRLHRPRLLPQEAGWACIVCRAGHGLASFLCIRTCTCAQVEQADGLWNVRDVGLPLIAVINVDSTPANGPDSNADTDHNRSKKETNT
jgi:hypothetical protein